MSEKFGYCEQCGAYQFLSYHTCNYNGICKGKILPELNYKITLSDFGKKTLDPQIYQQGVVVARKKHNGSVFVQWEGAIKPMWMPETYVDYGTKVKPLSFDIDKYTESDITTAWDECSNGKGLGYVITLKDLLKQLKK